MNSVPVLRRVLQPLNIRSAAFSLGLRSRLRDWVWSTRSEAAQQRRLIFPTPFFGCRAIVSGQPLSNRQRKTRGISIHEEAKAV